MGYKKVSTYAIFSFLYVISEVNTNLAEAFFWEKSAPSTQLEFRKLLACDLINNYYLVRAEEAAVTRRSKLLKAPWLANL